MKSGRQRELNLGELKLRMVDSLFGISRLTTGEQRRRSGALQGCVANSADGAVRHHYDSERLSRGPVASPR